MKICVLVPGNMIGGGVKMPVRLASHLADRHDVTLMYPRVPHYVTHHELKRTRFVERCAYICRQWVRHSGPFVFSSDLNPRVAVRTYFAKPARHAFDTCDVVVYPSVWQHFELPAKRHPRPVWMHWSLADYFFCSGSVSAVDDIMRAYLSGDVIVAPSEHTRRHLERYGVEVSGVVPGGVDMLFNAAGRERSDRPPRILGYFQPGWWVKGAASLLQCMRQLRRRYPALELSLVGHQRSDVATTGTSVCDRFYSGLTSTEMAALYRAHDIFVYPSYSDGFQSPPLEAMACGCAVVATRIGAVPEYGIDGRNMLIVDPMNGEALFGAVERLVRDVELRQSLSRRGEIDATGWTWSDAASKFEALVEAVINGGSEEQHPAYAST